MATNGILLGQNNDGKVPLIFNLSDINSSDDVNQIFYKILFSQNYNVIICDEENSLIYHMVYYKVLYAAVFIALHTPDVNNTYELKSLMLLFDVANDDYITYRSKEMFAQSQTVTLSSTGWTASGSVYTQTATVSGVSATETEQEIHVTPATASMSAYMEAGVYASAQAANKITFTASKVPTENLTVYAVIREL